MLEREFKSDKKNSLKLPRRNDCLFKSTYSYKSSNYGHSTNIIDLKQYLKNLRL